MSSIFGGPKITQQTPVALPDPNDPRLKKAAMDRARQRVAAGGRESTDLSSGSGAYSNEKLGQ